MFRILRQLYRKYHVALLLLALVLYLSEPELRGLGGFVLGCGVFNAAIQRYYQRNSQKTADQLFPLAVVNRLKSLIVLLTFFGFVLWIISVKVPTSFVLGFMAGLLMLSGLFGGVIYLTVLLHNTE